MKRFHPFANVWHTSKVCHTFFWLALVFGGIFVFLIPPFQSPDEPGHLLRAYQISDGVFFPEKKDQRLGGTLPASLAQVRDSFLFLKMNDAARLDKNLIFRCSNISLNVQQRTFLDFPNTAIYAPTAYLPQAAAIALLRSLGASPLQMLYAARLANLLVWALLVFAAIRLMPFLKNAMAVLALLPASLVMAASANADVLTNGLCWWLVAGFCARNLPSFKNLAGLAVVCANKLIALPLVLVYWLNLTLSSTPPPAPPLKRRGVRHTLHLPSFLGQGPGVHRAYVFRFALFFFVALTAALAWGSLAQNWFIPYDQYNPDFRDAQTLNEGVDPTRQLAFVIEKPIVFIEITIKSIVETLPSTAAHFVGKFGWEKNYLPSVWLALLWLALAAVLASERNLLSKHQRLLAAITVVLYVGMFAVTMYALWCPVGAKEVTNFQGRYFVPVAPVAALALATGWLQRFGRQIWWGAVLILIISNVAMTGSIVERYYRMV